MALVTSCTTLYAYLKRGLRNQMELYQRVLSPSMQMSNLLKGLTHKENVKTGLVQFTHGQNQVRILKTLRLKLDYLNPGVSFLFKQ